MVKYRLTFTSEDLDSIVVDYLGVFEEGKEYEITEEQADTFARSRGVPLDQSSLPDGVEIYLVGRRMAEDEEKE